MSSTQRAYLGKASEEFVAITEGLVPESKYWPSQAQEVAYAGGKGEWKKGKGEYRKKQPLAIKYVQPTWPKMGGGALGFSSRPRA